jgi:hypothetical protein
VTPYIEEHKQIISSQNPTKIEAWVTRHHLENLPSWLSEQVIGDSTIHPQLTLLVTDLLAQLSNSKLTIILFTQETKIGKQHTKIVVSV